MDLMFRHERLPALIKIEYAINTYHILNLEVIHGISTFRPYRN